MPMFLGGGFAFGAAWFSYGYIVIVPICAGAMFCVCLRLIYSRSYKHVISVDPTAQHVHLPFFQQSKTALRKAMVYLGGPGWDWFLCTVDSSEE